MISIHALRAEGDRWGIEVEHVCAIFLSTPSVRRATRGGCSIAQVLFYFYPRPPCGGRPFFAAFSGMSANISIHALRAEGD